MPAQLAVIGARVAAEAGSRLPWGKIIGVVVAGALLVGIAFGTLLFAGGAMEEIAAAEETNACNVRALPVSVAVDGLDPTQAGHAALIVERGRAKGIPEQGIKVALMTAAQESMFKHYANDGSDPRLKADQRGVSRSLQFPHDAVGSDHGSVNVFQQQYPWWGTLEQLMDPTYAADAFYDALVKVPDWQSLPPTVAAQRVQRSAFPSAYAKWEPLADQILAGAIVPRGPPVVAPAAVAPAPSVPTSAPVPAPVGCEAPGPNLDAIIAGGEKPAGDRTVADLVAFGEELRERGVRVNENAALGDNPQPGSHSPTGYHYKHGNSGAIDVNTRPGESVAEQRELAVIAQEAMNRGFGVIFMSRAHYGHLHIDIGTYRRVGDLSALLAPAA